MHHHDTIPSSRPACVGNEAHYIGEALRAGHVSGDGPFTKKCHSLLEAALGVRRALLTTSCTHALEMAALLLQPKPGDEVIVPSFTFVSTVNAFVLHQFRPIFADVRRDTFNIDEARLESLITPRTKAIVVVHYAGVACAMPRIMAIADAYGIPVIEDNAHGLFGQINDDYLGSIGSLGALSFHETKNFTCGEGGALLINEPALVERAEILREKGTNRSRFFRGEVDKYTWVDVGSSYLPSDVAAAYLWAQLEQRQAIQSKRQQIWQRYAEGLADWADDQGIGLPIVPQQCTQTYHMFYMILPTLDDREGLREYLRRRRIFSVFHYLPLHLSEMGLKLGGSAFDCPVTEWVSDRLLRLPFYYDLSESDQDRVIEAVRSYRVQSRSKPLEVRTAA